MRLHIVQGLMEGPDRLTAGTLLQDVERTVNDALGDRALAVAGSD